MGSKVTLVAVVAMGQIIVVDDGQDLVVGGVGGLSSHWRTLTMFLIISILFIHIFNIFILVTLNQMWRRNDYLPLWTRFVAGPTSST